MRLKSQVGGMADDFLGLELMALYWRLREARDPAVKDVIRRRIDARLEQAGHLAAPRPPAAAAHAAGAD